MEGGPPPPPPPPPPVVRSPKKPSLNRVKTSYLCTVVLGIEKIVKNIKNIINVK